MKNYLLNNSYLQKARRSNFFKSFSFLLGGTAITQIVTLCLSPILTRLYSPDDYGINSLYISSISILAVIVTLRLNSAIVIAKNFFERLTLIRLGLLTNLFVSLIIFAVIGTFLFFNDNKQFHWLLYIPISTFLLGLYEVFNASILNQNKFKLIAKIVVVKVSSQGIFQILFAYMGLGYDGLILGNISSILISLLLMLNPGKLVISIKSVFNIPRQFSTFKNFADFPKFAFPAEIASISSVMLFPFLISLLYSVEEVGHFALANKLIAIPVGLFGNSIRQVFIRDVSPYFNNPEILKAKFLGTGKILFFIAIPSSVIIYFIGPSFFEFVFGKEWYMSGIYLRCMIILLVARLTVIPLLAILNVIGKQKLSLFFNFSLILSMLSVAIVFKFLYSAQTEVFLVTISIIMSIVYLGIFLSVSKLLENRKKSTS